MRLALLITLLFPLYLWSSTIGKVTVLRGSAVSERGEEKIALFSGALLEEKDTIKTFENSQLQIIFDDKTVITLGAQSTLKIEEYFFENAKPKANFKFSQGTFKTITGAIGKKAPENFKMETKTATIGIRGTTVQGKINEDGDQIACTSGSIVVSLIGKPESVTLTAGQTTLVQPNQPLQSPVDIQPQVFETPTPVQTTTPTLTQPPLVATTVTETTKQEAIQEKVDAAPTDPTDPTDPTITTLYTDAVFALFNHPTAIANSDNNNYPTNAVLSGLITSQSTGETTLLVTLNKTAPSIDVSSSVFTLSMLESNIKKDYTHDDKFALLQHSADGTSIGKYFVTSTYGYRSDDYVSWGYWGSNYSADTSHVTTIPLGTWVAGTKTASATIDGLISSSANYTYTGHVIGSVLKHNGTIGYIVNDASNAVTLNVSFGSSVINGSIAFKTTLDSSPWNIPINTSLTNTGFTGVLSSGDASNGGSIKGAFYGPNAQSTAGTFDATKANNDKAVGSFKATR